MDGAKGHEVRMPDSEAGIRQTLHQETNVAEATCIRFKGRIFAVSEVSFISVVPFKSRAHDLIAIVQGSEVPFILRLSELGFKFIGQAYVPGIMDGELCNLSEDGENSAEVRMIYYPIELKQSVHSRA